MANHIDISDGIRSKMDNLLVPDGSGDIWKPGWMRHDERSSSFTVVAFPSEFQVTGYSSLPQVYKITVEAL